MEDGNEARKSYTQRMSSLPSFHGVSIAAVAFLILSSAWRLLLLFDPTNSFLCAPDFVNHIQAAEYWFSNDWYEAGYPPLVPVLLHPFLGTGFEYAVYKMMAVSFIAIIGLEAYLLIKRQTDSEFFSLLGLAAIVMTRVLSETISYGGIIRLAGIDFLLAFVILWGKYRQDSTRRNLAFVSVAVLGVMAAHIFIAIVFVLSILLYFLVAIVRGVENWRNLLGRLFAIFLPSIVLAPYYLAAVSRFGGGEGQGAANIFYSVSNVYSILNGGFYGQTLITLSLLIAAFLGILVTTAKAEERLLLGCILIVSMVLGVVPFAFRPQMPLLVAVVLIAIMSMVFLSWFFPLVTEKLTGLTKKRINRIIAPMVELVAPIFIVMLITVPTIATQSTIIAFYSKYSPQPYDIEAGNWLANNLRENDTVISVGMINGYWYDYLSGHTTYKTATGQWWLAQDYTFESELVEGRQTARVVSGRFILESQTAMIAFTPEVKTYGPQIWTNFGEMFRILSLDHTSVCIGNSTLNRTIDLSEADWQLVGHTNSSMTYLIPSEDLNVTVTMTLDDASAEFQLASSTSEDILEMKMAIHPVGGFSIYSNETVQDGVNVTLLDSQFGILHTVSLAFMSPDNQNNWTVDEANQTIGLTISANEDAALGTLKISLPVEYRSQIDGEQFYDTTTFDILQHVGAIVLRSLLFSQKYDNFTPFIAAIPLFNLSMQYLDSEGNCVVRIYSRYPPETISLKASHSVVKEVMGTALSAVEVTTRKGS